MPSVWVGFHFVELNMALGIFTSMKLAYRTMTSIKGNLYVQDFLLISSGIFLGSVMWRGFTIVSKLNQYAPFAFHESPYRIDF